MISLFKERKKPISKVFGNLCSDFIYSSCILVKDLVFAISTSNKVLGNQLATIYNEFLSDKEADYRFNFYDSIKNVHIDTPEDATYFYDFIRFYDTFFYYRYSKSSNSIDVILPAKFEMWEVENFFKIFISSISLTCNSLLIHASAIIKDGKAILFSGQSGAGKSTIAGLSGYEIIHDDNLLISHIGNGIFQMQTIPFKTPYKYRFFEGEIETFYRLFQTQKTYVKEVPLNKQLTHLLFGLWAFNYFDKKNSRQYNSAMLKYCAEILSIVPVKELYFSKSKDFLEII